MDFKKIIYRINFVLLVFLIIQNFLTALTPELGFDALWYHLTLPKLWLLKHQWYFPGGLLYYSSMPRLTEMIYTPLIQISGFVGPKLVQFASGVGIIYLISKISKQFKLSNLNTLIAVNLFYVTWLVSWQSGSAYIDLFRTFLEVLALYFLLKDNRLMGGLVLGLAIGTKWLSLVSLVIYVLLFGVSILPVAIFTALPWFLIAYHFTGNPVYPIFSPVISHTSPNLLLAIKNSFLLPLKITFPYDDFISPVAGLLVSICAIQIITSQDKKIKTLSTLAVLGALTSVCLNPPSSRFFLPYLPAASIATAFFLQHINTFLNKLLLIAFTVSAVLIVLLRGLAFAKYIPYLTGKQSVNQFLTAQSAKLPGTFIDSDGFVSTLPKNKKYLIDKLHNLFYFPYNYDHSSWAVNDGSYDYLITTNESGSDINGSLIHENNLGIQIFKLSK